MSMNHSEVNIKAIQAIVYGQWMSSHQCHLRALTSGSRCTAAKMVLYSCKPTEKDFVNKAPQMGLLVLLYDPQ